VRKDEPGTLHVGPGVPRWVAELVDLLKVEPGRNVTLSDDFDPSFTADFVSKKHARKLLEESVSLVSGYQVRLAAQGRQSVLLCLQALDAAGKDSTIRHVMSGVNPQGVHVTSFKEPSTEELRHDYLWRYAQRLPADGEISIFNRSHYEEVLVVRVHPELLARQRLPARAHGQRLWLRHFSEINDWERYVTQNGINMLKVCLNLSKEEQRVRFLRRLDLPDHHWKFSAADVRERQYWDDYQHALSEMLSHTSTEWAPWHVVPADHKWFARLCVSALLLHALVEIDPRFPDVSPEQLREEDEARAALLAEPRPDSDGSG
jgi:PPK2 family polyphosphate:nucleotide phosphotransferase